MFCVGTLISGPIAKLCYNVINPFYMKKALPALIPWWTKNFTKNKRVITSVLMDSLVIIPPYIVCMVFLTSFFGTRGNIKKSIEELKGKYFTSLKACWSVLPVILFTCYYFVPFIFRGIADNILSTIWSAIFSFV